MKKILFVDNIMGEVLYWWKKLDCGKSYELVSQESFLNAERTCELVKKLNPDVVFVGYGLGGKELNEGVGVINVIREKGYIGYIVANSGGGANLFMREGVKIDASLDRKWEKIFFILNNLFEKEDRDG